VCNNPGCTKPEELAVTPAARVDATADADSEAAAEAESDAEDEADADAFADVLALPGPVPCPRPSLPGLAQPAAEAPLGELPVASAAALTPPSRPKAVPPIAAVLMNRRRPITAACGSEAVVSPAPGTSISLGNLCAPMILLREKQLNQLGAEARRAGGDERAADP